MVKIGLSSLKAQNIVFLYLFFLYVVQSSTPRPLPYHKKSVIELGMVCHLKWYGLSSNLVQTWFAVQSETDIQNAVLGAGRFVVKKFSSKIPLLHLYANLRPVIAAEKSFVIK